MRRSVSPVFVTACVALALGLNVELAGARQPEKKKPEDPAAEINRAQPGARRIAFEATQGTWTSLDVSPDGTRLAWSEDLTGDERYRLRVIELTTRAELPAPDVAVAGGGSWCGDDRLVYLTVDDAWRPDRIWLHTLGGGAEDVLLWHEPDERFWLGVDESRDRTRVVLAAESKQSGEYKLLEVADPASGARLVAPRQEGLEYSVEVGTDALYLVHNAGAPEFQLASAPFTASGTGDWRPLLFVMTDGKPSDTLAYQEAIERVKASQFAAVIACAAGPNAATR